MDDSFARMGEDCDAPEDAVRVMRPLLAVPLNCSRLRPYGIHADLTGRNCPRCGWAPRRRPVRRS